MQCYHCKMQKMNEGFKKIIRGCGRLYREADERGEIILGTGATLPLQSLSLKKKYEKIIYAFIICCNSILMQ
jgi:hypothetical protein